MYQGVTPNVDPLFTRDLKEFDPQLRVAFDRAVERFVVTKPRAYGNPWTLMVAETELGEFRSPDRRDIAKLWLGDLWRHGGVNARIQRGEEAMVTASQKSEKKAEEEIRDATKDDGRYLRKELRRASNDGKANAEVRMIDVKRKGLTALEISTLRSHGIDPWAKTQPA